MTSPFTVQIPYYTFLPGRRLIALSASPFISEIQNNTDMKTMMINAAAGLAALCGLVMLTGDMPDANAVSFAAAKICGAALLWAACKVLERTHPEWEEEEA